jgi:sulfatase maturation enzyme AslB (radical SAM superfamily)
MINNNKLDITLYYVTNGTLLTSNIIDKLTKFKRVVLGVSLDATHAVSDFLRFPSKWNELEKILYYIDSVNKEGKLDVYFNHTFYNMNIFHLAETYSYCNDKFKNISFHLGDFVETPKHMNSQNLPKQFKEKIAEKIKNIPNIDFYINYMMAQDLWEHHGQVLHSYLNDLDLARHTDWKTIFPEIKNLYGL